MSVDIVNLIESNPITKLNGNYQSKLIEKIQHNFTNYEQQIFLSSFFQRLSLFLLGLFDQNYYSIINERELNVQAERLSG
jgi:hypothetical protein